MPTPAASRSERRTPAQNNALWSLMAQLTRASGLSKEELEPTLRESVRRASGQEHTSQLSAGQADRVLADLRAQLARYEPAPKALNFKISHAFLQIISFAIDLHPTR